MKQLNFESLSYEVFTTLAADCFRQTSVYRQHGADCSSYSEIRTHKQRSRVDAWLMSIPHSTNFNP